MGTNNVSAAKQVWARLPDGKVILNGQAISYTDNTYRQYPILYYKEIMYFPMTYHDCRFLGISTKWDNYTRTLYIDEENNTCAYRDYKWENKNEKVNAVEICDFNIVVNGKEIDNSKEPYPLIIFRDVTYFPLTWRFAVDEFGWEYGYDHETGLVINSNNYRVEKLELPETYDTNLIYMAMDDKYYYYNGNNQGLYRAKIDNISDYEFLCTLDLYAISDMVNIGFYKYDGNMYFTNRVYRGDTQNYKINEDGSVVETEEGVYSKGQMGYLESKMIIDGTPYKTYSAVGRTYHSYFENDKWIEVEIEGVHLRHYLGALGANVYIEGYAANEIPQNRGDIYCFNIRDKSIEKIVTDVEFDKAFKVMYSWDSKSQQMIDTLFFETDGKVMRCRPAAGELVSLNSSIFQLSENNTEITTITDGNPMFFAIKLLENNSLLEIYESDAYGSGSRTGVLRYSCYNGYASSLGDKILVKVGTGNPETEIHTAVITSYNQGLPFQTSDVIYGYYVDGDTMYHSISEDNAPNGIYKVNLAQYRNY